MDTFDKKVLVSFSMPISTAADPQVWIPDAIKDSGIKVERVILLEAWPHPNQHLGTYAFFISKEDASYVLLKYPEMKQFMYSTWPAKISKV